MVVGQTSCGSRDSKISILWQDHILRSDTKLKVLVVVGHAIVDQHRQGVLVILDLGSDRKWFVSEVSETSCNLLCDSVILVVVDLAAVIGHCTDVRVVVFVVVVEGIKEDSETNPLIIGSINWTLHSSRSRVPEC